MIGRRSILTALAVMALTSGALAQNRPGGGSGGGGPWRSSLPPIEQLETMTRELTDLTPVQTEKLKSILSSMDSELAEWQEQYRQTISSIRSSGLSEIAMRDKLATEVQKLALEREAILTEHSASIRALLTPAQNTAWAVYKLNQVLLVRTIGLGLSAEQKAALEKLVLETGQQIGAAKETKDVQAAEGRFWKQFIGTVLTDAQAQRLLAASNTLMPRFSSQR